MTDSKVITDNELSESDLLDNSSPLWSKVTSTIDNCLGQECPNATD